LQRRRSRFLAVQEFKWTAGALSKRMAIWLQMVGLLCPLHSAREMERAWDAWARTMLITSGFPAVS